MSPNKVEGIFIKMHFDSETIVDKKYLASFILWLNTSKTVGL
ncbi:hypothetical protein HMPREF0693_1916 [Proteus mirabilis ATCC 29906]|nr:hypothetical protein HMPREF0693_1916 [Proteus mirabilis ATCC 29906]KXC01467.1 hypothetical protein HMPREF3203_01001 [Proteus mirabilis]